MDEIGDEMISTIRFDVIYEKMNPLIIPKIYEQKKDLIVKDKNMIFQLTENQSAR